MVICEWKGEFLLKKPIDFSISSLLWHLFRVGIDPACGISSNDFTWFFWKSSFVVPTAIDNWSISIYRLRDVQIHIFEILQMRPCLANHLRGKLLISQHWLSAQMCQTLGKCHQLRLLRHLCGMPLTRMHLSEGEDGRHGSWKIYPPVN